MKYPKYLRLVFALCALLMCGSEGQSRDGALPSETLFPIKVGEKWGLIDPRGKVIVEPTFDTIVSDFGTGYNSYLSSISLWGHTNAGIHYFGRGPNGWAVIDGTGVHAVPQLGKDVFAIFGLGDGLLAVVRNDRSAGVLDLSGRLKGSYDNELITNGITEGLLGVKRNGKWGYVDRTGQIDIAPTYDAVGVFSEGMAAVALKNKLGYVDHDGRLLIKPQYNVAEEFSEGLAVVFVGKSAWYINHNGKAAFPRKFAFADSFSRGLARVVDPTSGLTGFIDSSGEYSIPPTFKWANNFTEGLAAVCYTTGDDGEKSNLRGYISSTGHVVLPVDSAVETKPFSNGLAWVNTKTKNGYIDTSGRWIWTEKTP